MHSANGGERSKQGRVHWRVLPVPSERGTAQCAGLRALRGPDGHCLGVSPRPRTERERLTLCCGRQSSETRPERGCGNRVLSTGERARRAQWRCPIARTPFPLHETVFCGDCWPTRFQPLIPLFWHAVLSCFIVGIVAVRRTRFNGCSSRTRISSTRTRCTRDWDSSTRRSRISPSRSRYEWEKYRA